MAEELGERTEAPTGRRRSEARQRGQIARSQDLGSALDMIGALVLLALFGEGLMGQMAEMLRSLLGPAAAGAPTVDGLLPMVIETGLRAGRALAPLVGLMVVIVYLAQLAQVGWVFTLEPLQPRLDRLNPMAGLSRLFARRSLARTLVSVTKLGLMVVVAGTLIVKDYPAIVALPALGIGPGLRAIAGMVYQVALWILAILLVVGLCDFAYQKWQHLKDLRMTRQEIKDERRSMDGDMETRAKRIKMGRQMILQRLRTAVPTADVVVTNPTHFAVALKYDPATMDAPRVVAKGADHMALRIRELAAANNIPIVEKPPLARALYASVDVGRTVPAQFYEAIAEILAYVFRLAEKAA